MAEMDDCIFCKIVKGEAPSTKEYEDSDVLAFRNIRPVAPIHVLVIPKKHIENLSKADDSYVEILGKIQMAALKVAKKLGVGDSFRILMASGKEAGQTVFHMHYHLIGGWKEKTTEEDFEREAQPGGLVK